MRLPLRRCIDGASSAAKQTPTSHANLAIMHPQRPGRWATARAFALRHAPKLIVTSNRTAQNRPELPDIDCSACISGRSLAWRSSAFIS